MVVAWLRSAQHTPRTGANGGLPCRVTTRPQRRRAACRRRPRPRRAVVPAATPRMPTAFGWTSSSTRPPAGHAGSPGGQTRLNQQPTRVPRPRGALVAKGWWSGCSAGSVPGLASPSSPHRVAGAASTSHAATPGSPTRATPAVPGAGGADHRPAQHRANDQGGLRRRTYVGRVHRATRHASDHAVRIIQTIAGPAATGFYVVLVARGCRGGRGARWRPGGSSGRPSASAQVLGEAVDGVVGRAQPSLHVAAETAVRGPSRRSRSDEFSQPRRLRLPQGGPRAGDPSPTGV
jgi:hypothetical protein